MSDFELLPLISTSCIAISGILVAIGVHHIKQKRIEAHQKTMFWGAVFATVFFIIYASRTLFIGNTSFGGPDSIKTFYTIFLICHITLATIGAVLGLTSLYTGYKKKLVRHRKLGPYTSKIWYFTAITGVMVYSLLYIFYKGGETTSLFKAILGF